ncbi:MAG: hypothetical protein ABMB14_31830 [Myxococcota bacterium]
MWFWFGVAFADDPGCKGRISPRDAEIAFEVVLDAPDGGPQRGIAIEPGGGPDDARGTIQSRLRTRLEALVGCYEARVTPTGGPSVTLRVAFDVARGRPVNVAVDAPPSEATLGACVRGVVESTPMACKLDAQGFAFPVRFYTATQ